ncbi:MAG: type IV pilus assembly protein PilM, partial [Planctomycetota bacterium]
MFRKSRTILGLDIGSNSIKAIELAQEGERYIILSYGQMEVSSEETQRDIIREVISTYGIKTRRVVTAVSGRSVIVRYVSMLQMSDEDLQNAIKFEADKYIPFEVEEVVLDCQRLEDDTTTQSESGEAEMKVLLVAVKRSLVDDHVGLIQQAGLVPTIIDIDAFALGNAFEFRDLLSPRMEEKEKVVALIDIGANKTNINIKRGRISYFTREIYLAGNDFTDAISKRLGLDIHEAELLKKDPGDR